MDTSQGVSSEETTYTVQACFPNARSLLLAVQAIKPSTKQSCELIFEQNGLNIRWQHESKALHSAISLNSSLWDHYHVTGKVSIGIPFATLLDTLAVFASSTAHPLHIRYPGPDAELMFESTEALDEEEAMEGSSMYARLSTISYDTFQDLSDHWEDPASYFLAPGALLREAVEDLEWTKGSVELYLRRDPQLVKLSSSANGLSLSIELPNDMNSGFHATSPIIKQKYAYKHLRTVFCNIPSKDPHGVATKVAIDANGMMKVQHMISVFKDMPQEVNHPLAAASLETHGGGGQRHRGTKGTAVFQLLPLTEFDDEEGADLFQQFDLAD